MKSLPKLNRRSLLKSAGGITAGAMLAPTAFCANTGQLPKVDIVVVDESIKASELVGSYAQACGIEVIACNDEVAASSENLWFDTLRARCCSSQTPVVAGLTSVHLAFELELFAKDAFYYGAFRGRHTSAHPGQVSHELRMPDVSELSSVMTRKPDNAWPLELASMLFDINDEVRAPKIEKRYTGINSAITIEASLASWVLAPMNRGRGAISVNGR